MFFRTLTMILFPILAVLASLRNEAALWLVALFGGSLWFVMAIILLCNWQVVTLFEDHLTFVYYGKKHTAFYRDIRNIKATQGMRGIDGPIALPTLFVHQEKEAKPLKINLSIIAARDRTILVKVIAERAPDAQLDYDAKEILQGDWSG